MRQPLRRGWVTHESLRGRPFPQSMTQFSQEALLGAAWLKSRPRVQKFITHGKEPTAFRPQNAPGKIAGSRISKTAYNILGTTKFFHAKYAEDAKYAKENILLKKSTPVSL